MPEPLLICPRCLHAAPQRPGVRFCPHCGMADLPAAASDAAPVDLQTPRGSYRVFERIAVGDVTNVYRCGLREPSRRDPSARMYAEGILKIARDARANPLLRSEAQTLAFLHGQDRDGRVGPFLPAVHDSFGHTDDGPASPARQANVLRVDESIRSPVDELYTLEEVRRQYPAGLDARDMAWTWRRLLSVLGFIHIHGIVHAAVVPPHILIEPKEHKLVLSGWGHAVRVNQPLQAIAGGYRAWYGRAGRDPAAASLDLSLAVRSMVDLVGGDAAAISFPITFPPALKVYFCRCLNGAQPDALKLLDDFDRLIEALWGPRAFRVLAMPAK